MNPHAVRKGGTHHTDETVVREGKLSVFGFILGAFSAKLHLVSSSSEGPQKQKQVEKIIHCINDSSLLPC